MPSKFPPQSSKCYEKKIITRRLNDIRRARTRKYFFFIKVCLGWMEKAVIEQTADSRIVWVWRR